LGSLLFVLHEVRLDKIVTQKKLTGSRKEARYVRGRLKSVAGIVLETFESLALSTSHYTVTRGFPLIKFMTKIRAEATHVARRLSVSVSGRPRAQQRGVAIDDAPGASVSFNTAGTEKTT